MQESISKKSVLVFKIRYTLASVAITFLMGFLGVLNFKLYLTLLVVYCCLFIVMVCIYAPLKYKNFSFLIGASKIKISYGVVFYKKITLSIKNIQYVETSQSIEQKFLKVMTLTFYTAGGKIILPQLDTKRAVEIKRDVYRRTSHEK